MIKASYKRYKCPYCSQTSSRKYNMQVHLERKHQYFKHPKLQFDNTKEHPDFNELVYNQKDIENYQFAWNSPIGKSSVFFPSPYFNFYPHSFFSDTELEQEENKKRNSERIQ